jgi:hypothetical protein
MPGQDMPYRTVEEGIVGGEDGTSGHAEDDLDSLVLEAPEERVCSGESGWFCHGWWVTKNPPGGRVERTQVHLRALHDEKEYVGGDGQVLHVRFPSKQLGESNVKIIGHLGRILSRSRLAARSLPDWS